MSRYGLERLVAHSEPCHAAHDRLAETVCGTMMQTGRVALIPEPIAKASVAEWLPPFGHQETKVCFHLRHGIDRFLQLGRDRQLQLPTRLGLPKPHPALADVLRTKLDSIGSPLTCPEHQLHSQTTFGAQLVMVAVLSDLAFGPGMEA